MLNLLRKFLRPTLREQLSEAEEAQLRRLVRAAFQWRRKQLFKILRDHPDLATPPERAAALLEAAGISGDDRPERLTPEQFIDLAGALQAG